MKAIKGLVLFMTLLLVAGLGLLGYGLYNKAGQLGKGGGVADAAIPGQQFGTVGVPLPAGAKVDQVLVAGGRVVLRVTGGGPERLVVLDPAEGAIAGSFVFSPEAPR